jgi:hypothetical protein
MIREGTPRGKKAQRGIQLTLFIFTVNLSGPANQEVSVNYSTQAGAATVGSDFYASTGTLTFLPGETSQTVLVNVVADSLEELDEGFQVVLSSPLGAEIADGVGDGMIEDDDTRGGGNNLPAARAPQAGSLTNGALPLPVHDVFAWQDDADYEAGHAHRDRGHDGSAVPLALALLTETLQLSQSADVELVNDNQRESADEMTNVDSRRDWLTPKEPIALTSDWTIASQADDEKRSAITRRTAA